MKCLLKGCGLCQKLELSRASFVPYLLWPQPWSLICYCLNLCYLLDVAFMHMDKCALYTLFKELKFCSSYFKDLCVYVSQKALLFKWFNLSMDKPWSLCTINSCSSWRAVVDLFAAMLQTNFVLATRTISTYSRVQKPTSIYQVSESDPQANVVSECEKISLEKLQPT